MGICGVVSFVIATVLCIYFLPTAVQGGYKLISVADLADGRGLLATLRSGDNQFELYGIDIEELRVSVVYEKSDRLHVHMTDNSHSRWEIPESILPRAEDLSLLALSPESYAPPAKGVHTFGDSLDFSYTTDPFGFAVSRQDTGEVLFNSTPSVSSDGSPLFNSMVFKDQYLEISTQLPKGSNLFGLGESTRPDGLRLSPGRMYTLWATDIGSNNPDVDLYGAYPFYVEMRKGLAHGVLFMNSNGMDVLYEADYLTYRAIGGIFDFYFFAGPTPHAVVDQYTEFVGRPAPMPYWSLGFHQCRWGYESVDELKSVAAGYAKAQIPLEVMWSDIDYMDKFKDFTVDPVNYPEDKLREFVETLHANDQKYVIILDPGIRVYANYSTLERGLDLDVYIKNQYGDPYLAQVWPGPVYFPDFTHPKIDEFWANEIELFHKRIPFDGLWIDMNEASNFCTGPSCYVDPASTCPLEDFTTCCLVCNSTLPLSKWDDPPYKINCIGQLRIAGAKTIALSATHHDGVREYDAHNLYGLSESIATHKALTKLSAKRPFILSRSTFMGSGAYTSHWTGDNAATWGDLGYSIVSALNSGIFGVPMVGADICGFQQDTWEELCNRWIQVGAFYPFSRNHADMNSMHQELYLWDSVAESARVVLGLRYELLPYYYTLIYLSHLTGSPVLRPLFFEYPHDPVTLDINTQFFIGSGILVSPVVVGGATSVNCYIPKGVWYSAFDFSETLSSAGEFMVLPAPLDKINIHFRQGSVIPMQGQALTTAAARKTPFTLVLVFNPDGDSGYASGSLFLDDGEDADMKVGEEKGTWIEFSAFKSSEKGVLRASVTAGKFALKQKVSLQTVKILGLKTVPSLVKLNGVAIHPSLLNMASTSELSVEIMGLSLPLGNSFELSWHLDHVSSS